MTNNVQQFVRWYDKDEVVSRCVHLLESVPDSLKRKTATFLMDQVIQKPTFENLVPDEIVDMATGDDRRRRWYDFDEVVRIFIELLKNCPDQDKRHIATKAICFVEDMIAVDKSGN